MKCATKKSRLTSKSIRRWKHGPSTKQKWNKNRHNGSEAKKKRWTKKNYLECRTAWYEIHICCKDAQTPIIHIALLKWRLVKSMVYDSAISKDRYGWKSRKIDTSDCKKLIDHIRANSKVEVFFVRALLRVFFSSFLTRILTQQTKKHANTSFRRKSF